MSRRRGSKVALTRREFMQSAAAVAAGAPLALHARERDDDDDDDRDRGRAACGGAPDANLVNGRFLTMDTRNRVVSALAIRDGRIAMTS
jgi:ferric-dicitrate binding protein FerR (iron transport regulator)